MRIYGDETFQCGFEWLFESLQAMFTVTGSQWSLYSEECHRNPQLCGTCILTPKPVCSPTFDQMPWLFSSQAQTHRTARGARWNSSAKSVTKQLSECTDVRINRFTWCGLVSYCPEALDVCDNNIQYDKRVIMLRGSLKNTSLPSKEWERPEVEEVCRSFSWANASIHYCKKKRTEVSSARFT